MYYRCPWKLRDVCNSNDTASLRLNIEEAILSYEYANSKGQKKGLKMKNELSYKENRILFPFDYCLNLLTVV